MIGAALLAAGVLASKLSSRFGIPAMLLFLVIGMLAGSEGPGGIPFDNPVLAMVIGSVALFLILFDGGLQTDLKNLSRTVAVRGALLARLGSATVCHQPTWSRTENSMSPRPSSSPR